MAIEFDSDDERACFDMKEEEEYVSPPPPQPPAPCKLVYRDEYVTWPSQTTADALRAHEMAPPAFYDVYATNVDSDVELLCAMALLNDWLALLRLSAYVADHVGVKWIRQLQCLLLTTPHASDVDTYAFGTFLWEMNMEGDAKWMWSRSMHPNSVVAATLSAAYHSGDRSSVLATLTDLPHAEPHLSFILGDTEKLTRLVRHHTGPLRDNVEAKYLCARTLLQVGRRTNDSAMEASGVRRLRALAHAGVEIAAQFLLKMDLVNHNEAEAFGRAGVQCTLRLLPEHHVVRREHGDCMHRSAASRAAVCARITADICAHFSLTL